MKETVCGMFSSDSQSHEVQKKSLIWKQATNIWPDYATSIIACMYDIYSL